MTASTVERTRALNMKREFKSRHFGPDETLVQLVRSAVMMAARNTWTAE